MLLGDDLFIRGSGHGLSWSKGIPLIKIEEDTWAFKSKPLEKDEELEYKILFNDSELYWEKGANQKISKGKCEERDPIFDLPPALVVDSSKVPAKTTRITVKCDAGFGKELYIRGSGPGMSWEKGVKLRNVGENIWVFETEGEFSADFEYKILLNDKKWEVEVPSNRKTAGGKKEVITSRF